MLGGFQTSFTSLPLTISYFTLLCYFLTGEEVTFLTKLVCMLVVQLSPRIEFTRAGNQGMLTVAQVYLLNYFSIFSFIHKNKTICDQLSGGQCALPSPLTMNDH